MADALRPPRDPRVLRSRRLRRSGHAPSAPCRGAAPASCRGGPGGRADPGPGRRAGSEPCSAGDSAEFGSRSESVRRRGNHSRCCRVHLDRTSGRVADGERSTTVACGDGSAQAGRVEARRSTAWHNSRWIGAAASAGQWPRGLGLPTHRGTTLPGGSRCLGRGSRAVGRFGAHRRRGSDDHGRTGCRDRPDRRVRTFSAPVVRPARRRGERVARGARWQYGSRVREASGLDAGGRSRQARRRGPQVRGRGCRQRRLGRRLPAADRLARCGPRPADRGDRGRGVAAGAPP